MFLSPKIYWREWLHQKLGTPQKMYGIPFALFKHLKKAQSISLIDIGAHDGSFTKAIAQYCNVSSCLLIEPLPHKAENLRKLFRGKEYTVFECVLGNFEGSTTFEINEAVESTSSILKIKREMPELAKLKLKKSRKITCSMKTLDGITEKLSFEKIDLVKIDVQGAEHLVFKGSPKTLKNTKMLWTEVSFKPLYEESILFEEIHFMLHESGFRLMELQPGFRAPDGEILQADALFMKP